MALWVEKQHGANGRQYIEQQLALLEKAGETRGVDLWRAVAVRFAQLRRPLVPIDGQPSTRGN